MKRNLYFFAMLAAALIFGACSSEDETSEQPDMAMVKSAIRSRLQQATRVDPTPIQVVKPIDYHWEAPFNVVDKLPEGKTPEAVYSNYFYYSTGEPFTVVMLYSNGAYRHICGLYWYEEDGTRREEDMWDERTFNAKQWYNPGGGQNAEKKISRLTDQSGAYEINLPKNTRFGFYQKSFYPATNNYHDMVYGTTALGKKDQNKPFQFYSEMSLNWNGKCQTVTFNIDESDWTVVGLEDISRSGSNTSGFGSDHDFNDCVFAVNPRLNIVPLPVDDDPVIDPPTEPEPDPEPLPIIYPNQGSVETNLSVTKKDELEHIRLSIHVRDTTDVSVTLPYVDEVLADDFAIVAKHDVEATYSEKIQIGQNEVELIYGMTADGHLTVTTQGVNAEVLDYCRKTYADGLTFECNLDLPAGAKISGTPTITFTKAPYVYITSCVNNSQIAQDMEVVWVDGGKLIYENPAFGDPEGLNYDHKYYSNHSLEDLLRYEWFVYDDFPKKE